MRCLSCGSAVPDGGLQVVYETAVCKDCQSNIEKFVSDVTVDLKEIASLQKGAIRRGILNNSFRHPPKTSFGRVSLLIVLAQNLKKEMQCHSPQTQTSPPQSGSSGEPLLPHVATLAALGSSGSTSPTE